MPQPQTVEKEIVPGIVKLLETGKQFSRDDKLIVSLEQKAQQLTKVNIRSGYVALAAISMLIGDFDQMRSRFKIANNQGLSAEQKLNYVTTLSHAGFFSEAAELMRSIIESLPDPVIAAYKAVLCFQFQLAHKMIKKVKTMNLTLDSGFPEFVASVNQITKNFDLDSNYLAQLADYAGEVMREHNVYYATAPVMYLMPDEESLSYVVATFDVSVSSDEASDMTLSLADKLFSAGMNVDNFTFRFRGTE